MERLLTPAPTNQLTDNAAANPIKPTISTLVTTSSQAVTTTAPPALTTMETTSCHGLLTSSENLHKSVLSTRLPFPQTYSGLEVASVPPTSTNFNYTNALPVSQLPTGTGTSTCNQLQGTPLPNPSANSVTAVNTTHLQF